MAEFRIPFRRVAGDSRQVDRNFDEIEARIVANEVRLDTVEAVVPYGGVSVKSGSLAVAHNTATGITGFSTATGDASNWWDETTGLLTVPASTAGFLLMQATVRWASNAVGYRLLHLQTTGGTIVGSTVHLANNGNVTNQNVAGMEIITGGEIYQLVGLQTSGGDLNVEATSSSTRFQFLYLPATL